MITISNNYYLEWYHFQSWRCPHQHLDYLVYVIIKTEPIIFNQCIKKMCGFFVIRRLLVCHRKIHVHTVFKILYKRQCLVISLYQWRENWHMQIEVWIKSAGYFQGKGYCTAPEMIPTPKWSPTLKWLPYRPRNDPDPEMIPTFLLVNPEMTPK